MKRVLSSILMLILIFAFFSGCADKLSEAEMAELQEKIEKFKQPETDPFTPNAIRFTSVDELVTFINYADLDKTKFKLLYEENVVFVPNAPESWGEFTHITIDSTGRLTFVFLREIIPDVTATPDITPMATLRPGTTFGPKKVYTNLTYMTWENDTQDKIKNNDRYKKIEMKNGIIGYEESGNVSWFYKDKYKFRIWGSNENIPEDAKTITCKKVSLNLG